MNTKHFKGARFLWPSRGRPDMRERIHVAYGNRRGEAAQFVRPSRVKRGREGEAEWPGF